MVNQSKYKLGNLELDNPYLLSPMLEPNDAAFRMLCKQAGAGLTFTGMVSPLTRQEIHLDDKPAMQLFGNTPEGIKEFMQKYDDKVSMWDFNLGCPSKLSEKNQHGAYMHRNLKGIKAVCEVMRANTKKPCNVKLRKSANAIKIAKIAEEAGFDSVAIHARTFKEGYSGVSDYAYALELKRSVSIPVIYSGDVTKENVKEILNDFDFVMIGRKAMGNPGIFSELLGKENVISFRDYLPLAKKYGVYFRQIKYQAMCFSKGEKNAKEIRRQLIAAKTIEDIERIYS